MAVAAILSTLAGCQATAPSTVPDFVALTERAAPSVVGIGDETRMWGSGFRLQSTDTVLTAAHLFAAAHGALRVRWQGHDYAAAVDRVDERTDIAVLGLTEPAPMPGLALASPGTVLRPGQWIVVLGCPFGGGITTSVGVIAALPGVVEQPAVLKDRLQLNAGMHPGISGGPVIAADGRVIGLATASGPSASGLGFATPYTALAELTAAAGAK